jgi:hypothetical protein
MSGDDIRHRVTDPAYVAAFGRRAREAFEKYLRENEPDLTDEQVAEILNRGGPPIVVWQSLRERSVGRKVTYVRDSGVAADAEELAKLRRRLPGGANRGGRTPGTNAVDDAGGDQAIRKIVDELRRAPRRVTLDNIAASSGAFTVSNLRYWLRANRKRLRDY